MRRAEAELWETDWRKDEVPPSGSWQGGLARTGVGGRGDPLPSVLQAERHPLEVAVTDFIHARWKLASPEVCRLPLRVTVHRESWDRCVGQTAMFARSGEHGEREARGLGSDRKVTGGILGSAPLKAIAAAPRGRPSVPAPLDPPPVVLAASWRKGGN